jgi:lysine 6-dehydrogenase
LISRVVVLGLAMIGFSAMRPASVHSHAKGDGVPRAIVFGSGLVGAVIAADLAADPDFRVTIADSQPEAFGRAQQWAGGRLSTVVADLADGDQVRRLAAEHDIVLGALASHLGYQTLDAVIDAARPYCDISFMPEDALALDAAAKARGVPAVVDCGVAPGMSNLLAAFEAGRLERCERIDILVGGLPRERRWPFEYKAGFSPRDVIEEYTRPARYVEGGEMVVREALSEPELIDFDGIGTLEAFNTDGLRSLASTLSVPNMKERTLRYPGHIELMRIFRAVGLFRSDLIEVAGTRIRPLDVISTLMFPMWSYQPGEPDLTVMRITVEGVSGGRRQRRIWDLLDYHDAATGWTSMARTTAFPCTIVARLLAAGRITTPGVLPPERLAGEESLVRHILAEHEKRGVRYAFRAEEA